MSVIIGAGRLSAAAAEEASLNADIADLVVYGKIFTSENNQVVEVLPDAVRQAKERGSKAVYGYGWDISVFKDNMSTRQHLDAICSDLPIYFADEEGHKGLANTLALVNAGIVSEDGTVLKKDQDIRSGEIVMGSDSAPTGYLKEQAAELTKTFL